MNVSEPIPYYSHPWYPFYGTDWLLGQLCADVRLGVPCIFEQDISLEIDACLMWKVALSLKNGATYSFELGMCIFFSSGVFICTTLSTLKRCLFICNTSFWILGEGSLSFYCKLAHIDALQLEPLSMSISEAISFSWKPQQYTIWIHSHSHFHDSLYGTNRQLGEVACRS
jgi:hypothetical protein